MKEVPATAMGKLTTGQTESSSDVWEYLEELVRVKVREFIQALLEDEVTELLGRGKSERRPSDEGPGRQVYRNGYGKRRRLTLACGTISVRRPRVRGLTERFESRILPLFARRTREIKQLLPQLYLHGLAQGDFDLALRGLLGEDAPISASTVARLKENWRRNGKHGGSGLLENWNWSTCGWMACTSRQGWIKPRRHCWWPSVLSPMAGK